MESITYRIDEFEGPLDLLLALIQKNKVNIADIPIALICDQYVEAIRAAESMDMEIAGEFIVMASELMLIKSRMLLPRQSEDEKDPRAELTDALLRYQQAKEAALKLAPLFRIYSGRMVKDTDEISIDPTYVADQQVTSLCMAVRRIIAANESRQKDEKTVFSPMIAKPIVPVDVKIVGILHRMEHHKNTSMQDLLQDATSLSDMIAIFLGILELVKVRKILIDESDASTTVHGVDTKFIVNENADSEAELPDNRTVSEGSEEPIPLSSKAEMHKEQRRILRERRLEERKRQRALDRKAHTSDLPADDSDLEAEAVIAAALDDRLSMDDEDLMDDLGLDRNEIIRSMAENAKRLPKGSEKT